MSVDDVDNCPDVSLILLGSSIKLVKPPDSISFSMVDIRGGVEEIAGGESLDGSLRCRIAVIARRNCVVNFCFGLVLFGAQPNESACSHESTLFGRLDGTNGFAL